METKKAKTKKSAKATKTSEVAIPDVDKFKKGLVVVESPAKAKTLKKYLGRSYDVKASVGHIKDLPKSGLGVDVDNNFLPSYEVIKGKQKVIDELKEAALGASEVYLASDPDREGEAIAWHVADILQFPKDKIKRVLFHEITKPAVLKALENPVELNQDRFESQQARRILDRLVGYKISPILWTKVRRGLSAGRVQSVAVRMICEREKEVLAFIPKPYWTIEAQLQSKEHDFIARLTKANEEKIDRLTIDSQERADQIVGDCQKATWEIVDVTEKERRRNPDPPFITSTLQQEASKRLYFSAKKTMMLAQKLYEGVDLGNMGTTGLITYMRTDSTRLSDEAVAQAREFISTSLGKTFIPERPNEYRNKKNAQDAHEAVRPTSTEFTPEFVKPFLEDDQFRLYQLIWKRYLASQAISAVFDQKTIELEAKKESNLYRFRATGSVLKFPGFLSLWQVEEDKADDILGVSLPDVKVKDPVNLQKLLSEKHMTQPPPRFSESSLIKELEEKGIGRPSTYAAILSTIQDRKYIEKRENRFYPTELGTIVTELLIQAFPDIVDQKFTASMEESLDKIEEGTAEWTSTLSHFYEPFEKTLKEAQEKMRNVKREETPTELDCPKCAKKLVIKWGKNGKFAACQGYPDCRFTSEFTAEDGKVVLVKQQTTDEKCPNCSSAMMVKSGRFGKFLACSAYPECKTTKPITTGIQCPECKQGELSEKRTRFGKSFYSCVRYPDCKYAIWNKPIKMSCPTCQHPFLTEHYTKKDGASIKCPQKCGYEKKVEAAAN